MKGQKEESEVGKWSWLMCWHWHLLVWRENGEIEDLHDKKAVPRGFQNVWDAYWSGCRTLLAGENRTFFVIADFLTEWKDKCSIYNRIYAIV